MSFHALELRRNRSACYAAPCTAKLVVQAIVFVAILGKPLPPPLPGILDADDGEVAHDDWKYDRRHRLNHDWR